ncbi:Efflux ABC transporter, ATP-binding protein [hydrothermal vent metagenome]|uniref:Efflux ABC transporter, ATP-binding protein n=1 Tax=hydrothermal vent metagenome TaxID=652676 RepID=A0A3B0WAM6_9ZZZZ
MTLKSGEKIAEIKNASKKFGKNHALKDVSLSIYSGEILSILGPNGAGKTTLISLMLGRLSLTSGNIKIFNFSPADIRLKRMCGAMLQVSGLPDMSTIKEQITLFQSYYSMPMPYAQIIQLAKLKGIENQFCKNLSGGQKQRLLFAISICGNPKLLFLDEPSAGMDASMRKSLWDTIIKLKQAGTSIVLTTHYLEEADQLSDRIIMLNQGEIIQQGSPDEIKSSFNKKTIKFICPLAINEFNLSNNSIQKIGKYYEITCKDSAKTMHDIFTITNDISDLTIRGAALEDAFISLNEQENTQ